MTTSIFNSIFDAATSVISVPNFLLCMGISLLAGIILALGYIFRSRYTKSFVIALALLPVVVCVVIMMVNGNIGAGVAVAGAFSLVRFRSAPGTAKDITMIFLAMGAGLLAGMGYLAYAILFSVIMCILTIICNLIGLGGGTGSKFRTLKISVPEDLDYAGMFDDLFAEYTSQHELVKVKTADMGSIFRLTYNIRMKDSSREKEFIDELRCRNGNLEIAIANQEAVSAL
ncbi:MAG: DUF4956 domain-containing protein [Parasporobacterium sp.]|nr:DUF4956 domain-containing protein [Parasporobacterium sp.]